MSALEEMKPRVAAMGAELDRLAGLFRLEHPDIWPPAVEAFKDLGRYANATAKELDTVAAERDTLAAELKQYETRVGRLTEQVGALNKRIEEMSDESRRLEDENARAKELLASDYDHPERVKVRAEAKQRELDEAERRHAEEGKRLAAARAELKA